MRLKRSSLENGFNSSKHSPNERVGHNVSIQRGDGINPENTFQWVSDSSLF